MNEYIVRCLILLFKIMLLIMSPLTFAENRPGFVCGKFNGHVMEVPNSYVFYWTEYSGTSAWGYSFTENTKGCDTDFVALPMIINWPDMQPGDKSLWYKKKENFGGIRVSIHPLKRPDTDMNYKRDVYLEKQNDKVFEPVVDLDELELFSVKVTKKIIRKNTRDKKSNYWLDKDVITYYWSEVDGRVPVVFDCKWLPMKKIYYLCESWFIMPEIGSLVRIIFTIDKLPQWQAIVNNTQQFILSHIKY
ncbi:MULTISPECIES: hypothetical protein [Yersinia]|uniref:hypothetical protein n=1 Tax=Yersinia TaxID=629 RepID=UPI0005E0DB04|nr:MULTISPECIES: hypothetical protein [Yersinia]CNC67955.1 Uncharacterised protein [Yersinia intermedia]